MVLVRQRYPTRHLGEVGRGAKVVGVDVPHPKLLGEDVRNGRLTRPANPKNNNETVGTQFVYPHCLFSVT